MLKRIALIAGVLLAVLSVRAETPKVPIRVDVPMRDGSTLRGTIVAFDDETFDLKNQNDSKTVRWHDVQAKAIYSLHVRLFGTVKRSAQDWFHLGELLWDTPDGNEWATKSFATAQTQDPSLRPQIQSIMQRSPATQPTARRAQRQATTAPAPGPWPELSETEMADALTTLKSQSQGALLKSGIKALPYETKYFVLFSNLANTENVRWANVLDQMYARLAELFDIPKGHNLWRGKAIIFAFISRDDFKKMEMSVFQNKAAENKGGFCHQWPNGNVMITFERGRSDERFAHILAHETTHGFLHRYRATRLIPSWVNEGLAETIAYELTSTPGLLQSADADAKATLHRPDALKDLFTTKAIENHQYVIVWSLTRFMIRQNKQGYVDFIQGIKDGLPWQDALSQKFGMTPDVLVEQYGKSMGVANLKVPSAR